MKLKLFVPTVDIRPVPAMADTLTFDPLPATATEPSSVASSAASSPSSRAVLGGAALIIVAGGAMRFAALSTSIWFDESVSVRDVSGSFGQMLHKVVNHEASPPFYFVCLWVWRHLVGSTAGDLRALSALAGTMTIALAFYVARRRIGQRAALVLAVCVAVSPVLVYYSTEMRMYGLLILITGIGFEAFLRASESPNPTNVSVWAAASILAIWTQYYAGLAVAPEAALLIALAWKRHPRSRATLVAVSSVALAGLPLIYLVPYQARHAFAYGGPLLSSVWHHIPTSIHVDGSVAAVAQELMVGPGGPARALLSLLILYIGVVLAVRLLLLRRPQITKGQLIRGVCLIAPSLLAVETLIHLHVLVEGRYLLSLWLPVGLAASYALASPAAGRLGLRLAGGLVCIWVGVGVVSLAVPKFGARDDTLGAARSLGAASTDRLIAINEPWDVVTLQQYRPQTSADTDPVVRVRELDVVAMPLWAEPAPAVHQRPSALGIGVVPKGLRLAQVIRGSTFLVERFVASTPVSIRVDGQSSVFRSSYWRFLNEPAGGRMGNL
jgi:Dolichyl-phosphate-mannose-protein mannosyltransferase